MTSEALDGQLGYSRVMQLELGLNVRRKRNVFRLGLRFVDLLYNSCNSTGI